MRFAELLSSGMPPNEAAAKAILDLQQQQEEQRAQQQQQQQQQQEPRQQELQQQELQQQELQQRELQQRELQQREQQQQQQQQEAVPVPSLNEGAWTSELAELESMGFGDRERNVGLLERYNGRLVRVVNALAGGD